METSPSLSAALARRPLVGPRMVVPAALHRRRRLPTNCAIEPIFLVGAFLIAVAIFFPQSWSIRRSLGSSLGEALIVAAILGFTVDKYIKEFLVRTVSRELFKYLVGYKLPEPIQNRLRDLMGPRCVQILGCH
jgi:hypothetical protein